MLLFARTWLTLVVVLIVAVLVRAQDPGASEPRAPFTPRQPETKQELDHLEAVRLYALGLVCERDDRLIEAVHAFERALRLDPGAAPVCKALVPLYLALDRGDDAVAACRRALDLDPNDPDTWQLLARQLRAQNRPREAAEALARAAACPSLKEHPSLQAQLWFDLGALCESILDYARAEAAFRQVAALFESPQHLLEHGPFTREELDLQAAETYERLGRVCLKARRHEQAVTAFRQAQKRDPTRAGQLSYNLAEVFLAQGKRPEALPYLDTYLESQPQGTEAYEAKVKVLRELGRGGEIVPALERYSARDRHHTALRLLLAREYQLADQPERAQAEYEKLIEESPAPEVYRGLFDLWKKQGRTGLEKVLQRLNGSLKAAAPPPGRDQEKPEGSPTEAARARSMLVVLRSDPELVKAMLPVVGDHLVGRQGLTDQTRFFFAVLAARAQQLETAEQLYRSCLDRGEGALRDQEPQVYGGLIRVLRQAGKHEAVIDVCQRGLAQAQATHRGLFHMSMAQALAHLGKMDAALEQANAAVAVARDNDEERIQFRTVKARLLAEAGRYDPAVAECQALLKEFTQPGQVREIRYALSSVYSQAKNYPRAEEQLQLILQADPTDATACNDLGYIWADQGKNLEEAEKLIRKALDLDRKQRNSGTEVSADSDQDNAAYVDSLGWVLFRRGRLQDARHELEKAAALPGGADDPVVWDHLGDIYFRLKEPARARSAWVKAVGLYETARSRRPDERCKEIRQKLKLLEP